MTLLNKKGRIVVSALALILLGASIPAKPILTALQADLMPITNNFHDNGIIFVINQGSKTSKSTWLTLNCSGACPDHPGMDTYSNPSFPNSVAIKIPALKSVQVFKHKLAFWDKVSFGLGKTKVLFFVDANNTIAEVNEVNNKKTVVFQTKKIKTSFGLASNIRGSNK
ncbi:MAG: hypothetical protein ACJAUP_002863 [Cellvibrionaceae bacterium]